MGKTIKHIIAGLVLVIGLFVFNTNLFAKESISPKEPTFNAPTGIAIDKEGTIWVADSGHHRIVSFKPGKFRETFKSYGKEGSGVGEFNAPYGVYVENKHSVWVADSSNGRIVCFDPNDFFNSFHTFGKEGIGNGQFYGHTGLYVDKGNVWVLDSENNRVIKFNKNDFKNSFISFGKSDLKKKIGKGDFSGPYYGIQVLKDKSIIISDSRLDSLVKFNPDKYLETFLTINIIANTKKLNSPCGIYVVNDEFVWVADDWNNRIVNFKLSNSNEKAKSYGKEGVDKGCFSHPRGVVASGNIVWVADTYNSRIVEFDKNKFEASFHVYGQGRKFRMGED